MSPQYEFFREPLTTEGIKAQFGALAKKHHPDLGGNTFTMQRLNAEYALAMDRAERSEKPGKTEDDYRNYAHGNESIRRAVEEAREVGEGYVVKA